MNFLINSLKGIAIGAGAILPGISSGVLCVIFGIYEKLLDNILNFFKDIKNSFKFLFPILVGTFIGILLFSKFLNFLFYAYPLQTKSIFVGLILGSIPSLIKEINKKEKFKTYYIFYTLFTFILGIVTVLIEKNMTFIDTSTISIARLFISGFAMSIGIVIPGISSTIILMLLGVYSTYLISVSSLYLPVLIPMASGILLGCIIFMKITKFLLDKFYMQTFYAIIGFTLGSLFILLPNFSFNFSGLICLLCITLGFNIFRVFKL